MWQAAAGDGAGLHSELLEEIAATAQAWGQPASSPPAPADTGGHDQLMQLVPLFAETKQFLKRVETVDKSAPLHAAASLEEGGAATTRSAGSSPSRSQPPPLRQVTLVDSLFPALGTALATLEAERPANPLQYLGRELLGLNSGGIPEGLPPGGRPSGLQVRPADLPPNPFSLACSSFSFSRSQSAFACATDDVCV